MTQAKKRVAIFASGTGSNFQALADDDRLKEVMTISKLVCDKPGAPVVPRPKAVALTALSLVLRSMLARPSLKQPF